MRLRRLTCVAAWAAALVAGAVPAGAALVASDNASTTNGYTANEDFNNTNGGSGFGAWQVSLSGSGSGGTGGAVGTQGGDFIGTTTGSSSTNAYLVSGAPVFDVWNNGDPSGTLGSSITTAVRPFTGGPLADGQTFQFVADMNNGSGGTSNQEGFELLDSNELGDAPLFAIYTNESTSGSNTGVSAWTIVDAANPSGITLSNFGRINGAPEQFQLVFGAPTVVNGVAALSYTLNLAGHHNSTGAYTGAISMASGGATAFGFYDNSGGNASDVEIGSLAISGTPVPEPGMIGLAGAGVLALLRRKR